MQKLKLFSALLTALLFTASCSNLDGEQPLYQSSTYYNYIQPSFDDYVNETKVWLTNNRQFITQDHKREILTNMPYEINAEKADKAILLVHGLGDSPFSFVDISPLLADQGFHVQVLLLPGHGSSPDHMSLPKYEDWQAIVDHYATLLQDRYDEVWLGGFSTGGNLVSIYTIEHKGIDGLLLFSPGYQSIAPFMENFVPVIAPFFRGYLEDENNITRYNFTNLKGNIQYSKSAKVFRDKIEDAVIDVPTLITVSESDSIIDPLATMQYFSSNFTNPKNKLIWYGTEPSAANNRTEVYSMHFEQLKISNASHMSALFSPDNPYYGQHGQKIICQNGYSKEDMERCKAGDPIWFSAWGYTEENKIYARLTWNPYFRQLEQSILDLVGSN